MKDKRVLDAHPSVAIVYSKEEKKFLMNIYDKEYPKKAYRSSANLIGGNPDLDDTSPENVLIREIAEELDPNYPKKNLVGEWASDKEIRLIRNSLLSKIEPFYDFYVTGKEIPGGNNPHTMIYSSFYIPVSGKTIECVEKNIREGKRMSSEGVLGIFTLKDLENNFRREFSTAHATASIINYKFGSKIPYPKAISCEPVGEVRKNYRDYLNDFIYLKRGWIRAGKAEN